MDNSCITYKESAAGPLRIGLFTDTYTPQVNGVAISLHLIAERLRAAGHQVVVFAPRFPGYQDDEPEIFRAPSWRYLTNPPIYLAVPGSPRYTWSLSRMRFDVLHANSPLTIGMLAYLTAATRHLPLIYTYHTSITDYTHHVKYIGETRLLRQAARWFSTASTNLGDQVVVPSAKFRRLLLEQNVHKPITVIPNGIDLRNFQMVKMPGRLHARLGLPPEIPILLSVGRIDPEKRLEFLIEVFACLPDLNPAPHLVLVGDGSARPDLVSRANATPVHDRIHFLGMVPRLDIPDLLHDATLFVTASTTEVHPLTIIEAITSGLPLVAVKDEAFEGMIINGENGVLTSLDIPSFSGALCSLLSDPAKRIWYGQRSRELSHKYSIEGQVQMLEKLYRIAIRQNNPGWPEAVWQSEDETAPLR